MSDLQDLIHRTAKIAYYQGAVHKQEDIIRTLKENLAEGENLDDLIKLIEEEKNWK